MGPRPSKVSTSKGPPVSRTFGTAGRAPAGGGMSPPIPHLGALAAGWKAATRWNVMKRGLAGDNLWVVEATSTGRPQ
jgi:hypothetical protein